jgi:DNA-binding transcriptional regulator YiaG
MVWIDPLRQPRHDDPSRTVGFGGNHMPREKSYFAGRLKQLRKAANLSQPGLADQSGVAAGTIREFE